LKSQPKDAVLPEVLNALAIALWHERFPETRGETDFGHAAVVRVWMLREADLMIKAIYAAGYQIFRHEADDIDDGQ
jgi:hypothetical protein